MDKTKLQTYFPESKFYDDDYIDWVNACLDLVPNYFWSVPASPSLKNHKEDGKTVSLVDHVRKVIVVFKELYHTFMITETEYDICMSAIILHDCFKCGESDEHVILNKQNIPRSHNFHPNYVRQKLQSVENIGVDTNKVFTLIEGHMGIWSPVPFCYPFQKSNMYHVDKKTLSRLEQLIILVHICDMVASRNYIKVYL